MQLGIPAYVEIRVCVCVCVCPCVRPWRCRSAVPEQVQASEFCAQPSQLASPLQAAKTMNANSAEHRGSRVQAKLLKIATAILAVQPRLKPEERGRVAGKHVRRINGLLQQATVCCCICRILAFPKLAKQSSKIAV